MVHNSQLTIVLPKKPSARFSKSLALRQKLMLKKKGNGVPFFFSKISNYPKIHTIIIIKKYFFLRRIWNIKYLTNIIKRSRGFKKTFEKRIVHLKLNLNTM